MFYYGCVTTDVRDKKMHYLYDQKLNICQHFNKILWYYFKNQISILVMYMIWDEWKKRRQN